MVGVWRRVVLAGVVVAAAMGLLSPGAGAAPGDLDTGWTGCGATAGTACTGSNGLAYEAYQVAVDVLSGPADRIRVATVAGQYNGQYRGGSFLALAGDGTLVSGWPATTVGFTGSTYTSAYDAANARIYVGGNFSQYTTAATPGGAFVPRSNAARLQDTGSIDSSWVGCYLADCDANRGMNSTIRTMAVDTAPSGGGLLVGGDFDGYNFGRSPSSWVRGIARITNAEVAPSWECRGGVTSSTRVYSLARLSDRKIIIGGTFTDYGNEPGVGTKCLEGANRLVAGARQTRSLIARINIDGSLDSTWTACGASAGTACTGSNGFDTSGTIRAVTVQPDGKILVAGDFASYDGDTSRKHIIRLNADGTRDTSFATTGTGFNGAINAIDLHPGGGIFVGGAFSSYDGTACYRVARLTEDGALDPSFSCSAQYTASGTSAVNTVAYQASTRRLIVGGLFTAVGGVARNYIAALSGIAAPSAPLSPQATAGDLSADISWTAPTSLDGQTITGYTVTGTPSGTCATTGATTCTIGSLTAGQVYTFTIKATTGGGGTGPASTATAPLTAVTVPGAPTAVTATAGNAEATVSWEAPSSDGASAITGYTVTGSPGGSCATTGATTCTITGLTNGTAYTFTVTATNAVGTGASSSASAAVTPTAPAASSSGSSSSTTTTTKPTATIAVTTPVDGEVTVTVGWSATEPTVATTLTTTLPTGVGFVRSAKRCATARTRFVSIAVPALAKGERGSCSYVVETTRTSLTLTVDGGAKPATVKTTQATLSAAAWVRAVLAILERGTPRATLNETLYGVRLGSVSKADAAATIRRDVLRVREGQLRAALALDAPPASMNRSVRLLRRSLVLSAKADRAYIAWLEGDTAQLGRAITYSLLATQAKTRLLASMRGHGVAIPPATTTWP